jgi:acylphosphatase
MGEGEIALEVRVTGRVQGVAFRAWTRDEASRLGLRGWVRNEADGSVSALVCGAPDDVSAMLERLKSGPSAARVDDVSTRRIDPGGCPDGFGIRR